MNKVPETYEELIRHKRCVDLTRRYELSMEELETIYNFLEQNPQGVVIGSRTGLTLKVENHPEIAPVVITSRCTDGSIDGLKMSNTLFSLIPHYVPSSSSGGSFGGSSSNNNNG